MTKDCIDLGKDQRFPRPMALIPKSPYLMVMPKNCLDL